MHNKLQDTIKQTNKHDHEHIQIVSHRTRKTEKIRVNESGDRIHPACASTNISEIAWAQMSWKRNCTFSHELESIV
jgi:hypothetical protein